MANSLLQLLADNQMRLFHKSIGAHARLFDRLVGADTQLRG